MKFKIGDKVRVIGNEINLFPIGNIVEIVDKYSDGTYEAYGYGEKKRKIYQTCYEQELELVKDYVQVKRHALKVYEVYEELKRHIGIENAISATQLCFLCGIEGHRELREIMREIRRSAELEKIPCSCNKGYYMASTKEEAQNAVNRLTNAAKNEFKTAYVMMKKLGLDGQMKIHWDEFCEDTYHSLMEKKDDRDYEC